LKFRSFTQGTKAVQFMGAQEEYNDFAVLKQNRVQKKK
jgi:DNA polymerase-3 subunit epsilon